jgi:hypothetical protein
MDADLEQERAGVGRPIARAVVRLTAERASRRGCRAKASRTPCSSDGGMNAPKEWSDFKPLSQDDATIRPSGKGYPTDQSTHQVWSGLSDSVRRKQGSRDGMQNLASTYAVPNACRLPAARQRSDLAERERPPPARGRALLLDA